MNGKIGGDDSPSQRNEVSSNLNVTSNYDIKRISEEFDQIITLHDTKTKTSINRKLEFIGNLTEEQRTRLLAVANACPVHKLLTNPIEISSSELKS